MPASEFSGKTVLLLGATAGIGRAAAIAFADAGARVVVAGLGASEGRAVEAELVKRSGTEALFIEADVTAAGEVRTVVEDAADRFGRIHAAVNNAG
ncbi:MAG: SDR family NAD(P)-dependent oxidoreductase, partial [Steroidobacteraceae bacterium]